VVKESPAWHFAFKMRVTASSMRAGRPAAVEVASAVIVLASQPGAMNISTPASAAGTVTEGQPEL